MAARSRPSSPAPAASSRHGAAALVSENITPWRWLVPLGLVLLCVAVYGNSFGTGFTLDSRQLILRDARVHDWTTGNLSLIVSHSYWWPYGESGLYRPLTTLSYLFNYAVLGNGQQPAGYHAFNLLFHIANVLLLWRVALRVTGDRWSAAAAAALWAVLPLSTEAVTNIVGRADLMAATGALVAVLLYVAPSHNSMDASTSVPAPSQTAGPVRFAATAVAIALGTLAKESAVAVVGLLLIAELLWWRAGRSVGRTVALAASCAVPLGWWAWQRAAVLGASGAAEFPFTDNPIAGATFWQAKLTAVQVMWRYVTLLVWPAHLSNDYSFAQIPLAGNTTADWVGAGLLAVGVAAALWQARSNRPMLFFAAFALVTFLPASNLLFATGTIMGERLVYLPSCGLAVIVALVLRQFATSTTRRGVATAAVVLLVAANGARTWARNPDWTSDLTLWRTAVAAAPASAKAHRALAEALYDADPTHANIDDVIRSADHGVALLEPLADEQNTFQAFRQAGAYYLDKANRLTPNPDGSPQPELRRIYSRALNLLDRAVMIARAGRAAVPGGSVEPEADAQRLRAAAILGLENPTLALVAAKRSRALSPFHPLGYHLSGAALLAMQSGDEAVMTLLTGSIVTGDAALGQEAMTLYASGIDTEGCAVTGTGTTAALNPNCPTVLRHSCIASAAAYQILKAAGPAHEARAEQLKASVIADFGCPAELLERPNSLVP